MLSTFLEKTHTVLTDCGSVTNSYEKVAHVVLLSNLDP